MGQFEKLHNDEVSLNKYYTPTLDEFHVGFEYELLSTNNQWVKETFHQSHFGLMVDTSDGGERLFEHCLKGYDVKIRVKYIDKVDIESLGWKYNGRLFEINSVPKYATWTMLINENRKAQKEGMYISNNIAYDQLLITFYHPDNSRGEFVFYGFIKNKSELRRLMKQLGI